MLKALIIFYPFINMLMLILSANQVFAQNFTVVGNKIYDPEGNEFIAQGTNVTGEGSLWNNTTLADKDKIINCWNFNTIRLYFKLYTNSSVSAQDAYDVIDAFTAEKIVVIAEVHDNIGKYFENEELDDLKNFWREFSSKYKNNPYVWFDLHNEPGNGSVDYRWVIQHQEVIKVIRDEVLADNIIIVEGGAWGQDAPSGGFGDVPPETSTILTYGDEVKSFNGYDYENIVFSLHIYDQYRLGGPDRIVNYIDAIWAKGHALIIGEWGNHNVSDVSSAMHAFAEAMHLRNVGRIVWHWEGGDNNDLTTMGRGSNINDCQNPTNLTDLGHYVWLDNQLSPFDTVPPSAIDRIQLVNRTSVSLDISWEKPEDVDFKGYYIYFNNQIVDTVKEVSYGFYDLNPSTTYEIGITAYDLKLNASELKNLQFTTLDPDVVLPSAPETINAVLVKSTEITLLFSASSDNQGVKGYRVFVNDELASITSDTIVTLGSLLPDTDFLVHVKSEDLSGNLSNPSPVLNTHTYAVEDYAVINNDVKGNNLLEFYFIGDEWQTRKGMPSLYKNDEEYTYATTNRMEFKFTGSKVLLYGRKAPSLGKALVKINNGIADTINYHDTEEAPKTLLFKSGELPDGEHFLILQPLTENKYINIDWAEVICSGCMITSTPQKYLADFKVYPVPASQYISIEGLEKVIFGRLTTLEGKIIKEFVPDNQAKFSLQINDVTSGVYILSIYSDDIKVKSYLIPIANNNRP